MKTSYTFVGPEKIVGIHFESNCELAINAIIKLTEENKNLKTAIKKVKQELGTKHIHFLSNVPALSEKKSDEIKRSMWKYDRDFIEEVEALFLENAQLFSEHTYWVCVEKHLLK